MARDAIHLHEVPHLRGILHMFTAPVVLFAGVLLAIEAPTVRAGLAGLLFATGLALTFGTSAAYHRGRWSTSMRRRMRQLDHSMIFVSMAVIYSAFWVGALNGKLADVLLVLVWGIAILATTLKVSGLDTTPGVMFGILLGTGLLGLLVVPQLSSEMGLLLVAGQVVGGLVIAIGGIVFVMGRPNPIPRWLGFHELFHGATVVGASIQLATFGLFLYGWGGS